MGENFQETILLYHYILSTTKAANLGQLGNISNIPYAGFPGVAKLPISKFPGLAQIPIAQTIPSIPITNLPPGVHLVRIDKVRTNEKGAGVNPKIVTGSDQRRKAQWTSTNHVNVAELRDSVVGDKSNLINGALMVDGSSQMIPGGNVPSPSPLQPTALPIVATNLALSVHDLNAKNGTARLQLNMRLEYPFGLRTSYFIPIPIPLTVSEKGKTTIPFPLEISQPSPVTANAALPTVPKAATNLPKVGSVIPSLPAVAAPALNPVVANIANGNIGIAVKTNAINPATVIGG